MALGQTVTPEIEREILRRLADGESLRAICKSADIPSRDTVHEHLNASTEFNAAYELARQQQADALFDEIQEIADTGNTEDVQRARLRVDTLKWRLGRMAPKKYGDKVAVVGGGEGDAPIKTELSIKFV